MHTNISEFLTEEWLPIIVMFLNISLLIILSTLLFFARATRKRWDKLNDYLGDVTKTVNSVRYGDLTKKINNLDIPESNNNLTESLNRMIETLKDREVMIDEFQKDLIKQNKILERTVNSLSDGLVIVNETGEIYRANSVIAKWFVVDGKTLPRKSIHDYIDIPENKRISTLDNDEIIVHANQNSNFSASTVELNLDDKKERFIIIIKNITNQKELESLKEDFVATLTHDLKVPIIAEKNMIELFLNQNFGDINEKQSIALKNMEASNKELLELVQTVLDTYKIGKITLHKENILLKAFIQEIIAEMNVLAHKSGNSLDFVITRDIRVYADRFQLKRVIKNLIQNAISYGKPKTPIRITIGEIPDFIYIKIKDFGAGISKEDIEKIFNKYYSAAKKFRKIGTGLGLYLARQITKAHNGDLTVESVEGEFTEFCVKIPVDYERNTLPY